MIKLIVACSDNGVIGKDGTIPWNLKSDMRHFVEETIGTQVIMGRKTFDSLKDPLKNRMNTVVSRTITKIKNVTVFSSIEDALKIPTIGDKSIIGGGEIYKQCLDLVDQVVLTRVHCTIDGDTFFDNLDETIWEMKREKKFEQDDENDHPFTIQWWIKK